MNGNPVPADTPGVPHKRLLRVELSADQIVERARRAERLRQQARECADELRQLVRDGKAQIERMATEIDRLSAEVRDGVAELPVDCQTRLIPRIGLVQVVRTDTGEVVFERPMTGAEREKGLGGGGN